MNNPARTSTPYMTYVLFSGGGWNGTRSIGVVALVARAALEPSAAGQQEQKVFAVAIASAARHTRPEPSQSRCTCVSSI